MQLQEPEITEKTWNLGPDCLLVEGHKTGAVEVELNIRLSQLYFGR